MTDGQQELLQSVVVSFLKVGMLRSFDAMADYVRHRSRADGIDHLLLACAVASFRVFVADESTDEEVYEFASRVVAGWPSHSSIDADFVYLFSAGLLGDTEARAAMPWEARQIACVMVCVYFMTQRGVTPGELVDFTLDELQAG